MIKMGGLSRTRIGVDVGTRAVKLVQFCGDGKRLMDTARWDFGPSDESTLEEEDYEACVSDAINQARDAHNFRGKEAIVCLTNRDLFIQNIRVPTGTAEEIERSVRQEAVGRLPYSLDDAELKYIESGDVKQGDNVMREVIVFACPRSTVRKLIRRVEAAGLIPVSIDLEPAAVLRTFVNQYSRQEDAKVRTLVLHVGHSATLVMIAEGEEVFFVKYVDIGGRDMDKAVADFLELDRYDASSLRRFNGERREDRRDPEIERSVGQAIRPILDRLFKELAMCLRYHSVTFRGKPLGRIVLGGPEATDEL
ncbi:MAG: type IV pilus assembly protein PilM, partial [Pirellulaceae bacterium]